MAIEKNQNPRGHLGAKSKTALTIQPISTKMGQIGCLAGSFKTVTRILIFFNCHGCQTFILAEIHCYISPLKSLHHISFLSGVTTFTKVKTCLPLRE